MEGKADDVSKMLVMGRVEGGALHLRDGKAALWQLKDGPVIVTVQEILSHRTLAQNAFWHSVVVPAFMTLGYEFQEAKDALALELIPIETRHLDGTVTSTPGHTADLDVEQFSDLIRRAVQLGARYDVMIPDPGEIVDALP